MALRIPASCAATWLEQGRTAASAVT